MFSIQSASQTLFCHNEEILNASAFFRLQETRQMTVLDKAKVDCLSAFALNSLVWMWLRTKGVNPKESEVCVYLKNEMRMSNSNPKISSALWYD